MSNPTNTAPRPSASSRAPQIGVIPPAGIERAFVAALYLSALGLALLSVIGTFFGMLGLSAVLWPPDLIAIVAAQPLMLGLAVVVQFALSLAQYGARQMAHHDRRWWLLYLAALALSVWYNLIAYHGLAVAAGVPWLLAGILIIAADVFPELVMVRRR